MYDDGSVNAEQRKREKQSKPKMQISCNCASTHMPWAFDVRITKKIIRENTGFPRDPLWNLVSVLEPKHAVLVPLSPCLISNSLQIS